MPKLSAGQIPKYRHQKSRGLAVVRINGTDYYLGPWKSKASLAEYDRLHGEWFTNGRIVDQEEDQPITVVELVAAYLKFARSYYRKNGKVSRQVEDIKTPLALVKQLYGKTPASEFGPLRLKAIRQKMIDKEWSRSYINKQVNAIRRVFKWAASEELIPSSVFESLRSVDGLRRGRSDAREIAPVMPVVEGNVKAVLPHLSPAVGDMVRLHRLIGARPNEICIMRLCDVDRSTDV